LIPDRVDNASGFDVEKLRSMIEPKRAEGQAVLRRGPEGEEALLRKKERRQERVRKLWEQFEENEKRSEQITDSERLLVAVNSVAGSSLENGEQAEQELAEISREQRHILEQVQDLRVSIFVLRNLLYRQEQSLSNTAEAWEVLYEPFELAEEEGRGPIASGQGKAEPLARDRTVSIGRALIRHQNEHDALPYLYDGDPLGGKLKTLYEWVDEESVLDDNPSASTIRRALVETGCLRTGNQGASADMAEIVDRIMQYARGDFQPQRENPNGLKI
jgi:hypothetical protein